MMTKRELVDTMADVVANLMSDQQERREDNDMEAVQVVSNQLFGIRLVANRLGISHEDIERLAYRKIMAARDSKRPV